MIERGKLNRLVVQTLRVYEMPRAVELYCLFRREQPDLLREEKVTSFRGFVKILNSFSNVKAVGVGIKKYVIK